MRIAPMAVAAAAVLASASPASALAMKIGSRDCGSPPLSTTLGVQVQLAPVIDDPFGDLVVQTGDSLALCPDAFGDVGDASVTSFSVLFDFGVPEFDPDFAIAPDSAWSGFTYDPVTGLLSLFPLQDELPLEFSEVAPDLSLEFLCDRGTDVLCNPFVGLVSANATVTAAFDSFATTAVPEPATWVLVGTGMLLAGRRRTRRRQQA